MEHLPPKSQKSFQLVASLTDPIGEMGDPSNINQQEWPKRSMSCQVRKKCPHSIASTWYYQLWTEISLLEKVALIALISSQLIKMNFVEWMKCANICVLHELETFLFRLQSVHNLSKLVKIQGEIQQGWRDLILIYLNWFEDTSYPFSLVLLFLSSLFQKLTFLSRSSRKSQIYL